MKNIYILCLIVFMSCQDKTATKLPRFDFSKTKYFLAERDCCSNMGDYMLFEFKDKKDSLKGIATHISFFKDSPTVIKGTLKDSIIKFTYKESGRKDSTAYGIIGKDQIKLQLNGHNNLTLKEIDSITYYTKYLEAHPKLLTLQKDTIIGDYLFELKIKNWNSRTKHGVSTITIKDKTSKADIQQITSEAFYFYNKDKLYFDYYEDYNFDNITDLSFYTGTKGPYASNSFNYYIYDKAEKKFIRSIAYETIANAVSFEVDTVDNRMLSYNKGSCCMHYADAYKWVNDTLQLVKSLSVDNQYKHRVILKQRIDGQLKTILDKPDSHFTEQDMTKIYDSF